MLGTLFSSAKSIASMGTSMGKIGAAGGILAGRGASAAHKGLSFLGTKAGTTSVAAYGGAKSALRTLKLNSAAERGLGGAVKGFALGAGLSLATGNASWMPLMAGAGGFRGASAGFLKPGSMFGGGRLARNMAIGSAVGVATDNPNWAVYGAVGLPLARKAAGFMASPRGSMTYLKGLAQVPFSPRTAARTFGGLGMGQAMAAPAFMGLVAGAVYNGAAMASNWGNTPNDVNSGRYPGGVAPLHPGRGQGIPNDNLATEGLTLALHKQARKTRHM